MTDTSDVLVQKLKALTQHLWSDMVSWPMIRDWLKNFPESQPAGRREQLHGAFLLSQFMYFGIREMRELLKALYRDVYKYPIVERLRRSQADRYGLRISDGSVRGRTSPNPFSWRRKTLRKAGPISCTIFDRRTASLASCLSTDMKCLTEQAVPQRPSSRNLTFDTMCSSTISAVRGRKPGDTQQVSLRTSSA